MYLVNKCVLKYFMYIPLVFSFIFKPQTFIRMWFIFNSSNEVILFGKILFFLSFIQSVEMNDNLGGTGARSWEFACIFCSFFLSGYLEQEITDFIRHPKGVGIHLCPIKQCLITINISTLLDFSFFQNTDIKEISSYYYIGVSKFYTMGFEGIFGRL